MKSLGPDGSTPLGAQSYAYVRNITQTFDGASANARTERSTDSLGRISLVVESPFLGASAIRTEYAYDGLDNLTSVTRSKASEPGVLETRSFAYDSLSRIRSATNPENGTVCYGQTTSGPCKGKYDGNGNLRYRTDARGVVTELIYDGLGRLKTKGYSGCVQNQSTCPPLTTFAYDASPAS